MCSLGDCSDEIRRHFASFHNRVENLVESPDVLLERAQREFLERARGNSHLAILGRCEVLEERRLVSYIVRAGKAI